MMSRALLCLACLPALSQDTYHPAEPTVLKTARAEITINNQITRSEVQLPYGWDSHHRGLAGSAVFHMDFEGPEITSLPWILYFPRLGNAYIVKLNDAVLEHNGVQDSRWNAGSVDQLVQGDYAKVPRTIRIAPSLLLPRNHLEVTILAESGHRSGMSQVWVGPRDAVDPIYQAEFALRVGGSVVLTAFSLMVGIFSGALWLSQTDPRPEQRGIRDPLYLYAAVAECAWALFVGDSLIERLPLSWPWWSVVTNMALGVWLSALLLFCHTLADWTRLRASVWVQRFLYMQLVLGPVFAYTAVSLQLPLLLTIWQAAFALVFVPSAALFIIQSLFGASGMHQLVAAALLINVPIGLHDFLGVRLGDGFAGHFYLRYSATLFGLALAVIAINRFRTANLRVRDLLDTLAIRVDEKQKELAHNYQQMDALAREKERVLERSRIMRDMHDGVGSHISSAIRQLRAGPADTHEVMLTLQDSLDQLKLSIDALNLPPGDITSQLANLRYRLEPRFQAMGLTLQWAVLDLPLCPQLDADGMRQLQFIFMEAFSNVMQHAHATVLRIEATPALPRPGESFDQGVRMRVVDNGNGFDATSVRSNGLLSMQERARAIGAQLTISSRPGETSIELLLPHPFGLGRQAQDTPVHPHSMGDTQHALLTP
jgi:signal transduction histidine kinase